MRESSIESKVVQYARSKGVYTRKYVTPGYRGAPDRIFIHNGRVMLIEFKAPGQRPTPQQLREHAALRAAGALVAVCDDPEYGKALVDAFA